MENITTAKITITNPHENSNDETTNQKSLNGCPEMERSYAPHR